MSVTPGHFTLSPEQRHFKQMLEKYSRLMPFWNFQNRDCHVQKLEEALPAMSHGEQIMARFFASVWLGENKFDFDLIDAAGSLDSESLQVILDWLAEPMFP